MTEATWRKCRHPDEMLKFLSGRHVTNQRKWLLFASACCRRIWDCLTAEHSHYCVEIAEKHADGLATKAQWNGAIRATQFPYAGDDQARWRCAALIGQSQAR